MNRFPLSRCASAIQIVCPLESIAETQLQLQPTLLRLSLTLGIVDHSRRRFTHFKLCAHFLDLRCLLFRRRCDGGHPRFSKKLENHEHASALFHALQLLPDSSDVARNSGNGSWDHRSRVEFG